MWQEGTEVAQAGPGLVASALASSGWLAGQSLGTGGWRRTATSTDRQTDTCTPRPLGAARHHSWLPA